MALHLGLAPRMDQRAAIILFARNGLHCDDTQKAVMMLTPGAAARPKRTLSNRCDQKMW
jgi:hypothetical protein